MLFPAGPGFVSTAPVLTKYRELVRKFQLQGGLEESQQRLLEQAKERLSADVILARLRERRRRGRLDPRGALQRTKERFLEAGHSLRELKNEHKERLRQYYHTAVRGGSLVASQQLTGQQRVVGEEAPYAAAADLDARALQSMLGTDGLLRHLVLAGVGGACRLFLHGASRTTVEGAEHMRAALERPPGQALITVSNHVGSIDDPLITSALVPPQYLLRPSTLRWTMCATDRCFKSQALVPFFRAAKVLPVERGAGLDQFGMRVAASRLAQGDWVHIFPEGTRSRSGKMGPVRRGVGWLVASCDRPPLVLPFVHSGMERVIPKGAALPQPGQEVRVLVGPPVPVADLLAEAREQGWEEQELQMAITRRVGQALYQLKAQLEGLPLEEVAPEQAAAALSLSDERLLPLIEAEMEALQSGQWRDRWQRWALPSLRQRLREAVAARAGQVPGSAEVGSALDAPTLGASFAAWAAEHVLAAQQRSAAQQERLQAHLAAAQQYSAARVQRMRELMQQHAEPAAA